MLRRHRLMISRLLVYFDAALVFLSYAAGVRLRHAFLEPGHHFWRNEFFHVSVVGGCLTVLLASYKMTRLYESQRMTGLLMEVGKLVVINLAVYLVVLAIGVALLFPTANLIQLSIFFTANTALVVSSRIGVRTLSHYFRRTGYNYRNLIILASSSRDPSPLLHKIVQHDWWGYRIIAVVADMGEEGTIPPDWDPQLLPGAPPPPVVPLNQSLRHLDSNPVDEIWVDGMPEERYDIYDLIESATDQGVVLRYILARNFFPGVRWGFETFDNITTLSASHSPMDDLARIGKRAMDVAVSSVILAITMPVMIVTAILLSFEKGGVLFRQQRVGLNGRLFTCYKFRTMIPDAEARKQDLMANNEMGGPVFKMTKDPRITPLGAYLRKFSIDELPQLFNVLRGDMSLVGPRPPVPSEVNQYERTQKRRLSVKPGITGLWQVSGRNEISSFEEWVALDLEYIDQWSLMLDVKIILKTIPAVLAAKGAK